MLTADKEALIDNEKYKGVVLKTRPSARVVD
jgi:hypothetical protein